MGYSYDLGVARFDNCVHVRSGKCTFGLGSRVSVLAPFLAARSAAREGCQHTNPKPSIQKYTFPIDAVVMVCNVLNVCNLRWRTYNDTNKFKHRELPTMLMSIMGNHAKTHADSDSHEIFHAESCRTIVNAHDGSITQLGRNTAKTQAGSH